jgi:hypothetical protein
MSILALYCKSYRRDIDRVEKLALSIQKFNEDKLPFYLSVPTEDIELFKQRNLPITDLIPDEDIFVAEGRGWVQQQIVKSNFWKLDLCENYLCLDSDSYFIKPFYQHDFIAYEDVPYTVMHEQKELFEWAHVHLHFNPQEGFNQEKDQVMSLFNRQYKKRWDFGPSPTIWSKKVWKSLEDNYIIPNELSFEKLIEYCPSEFTWYGEALLAFRPFEILPVQPLFKVFHYPNQFIQAKQQKYTESIYTNNYYGIILQSNFNAPLDYE